jgi:hypothetical protein
MSSQLASPAPPDPAQLVVAIRSKQVVDAYRAASPDILTEQISDDVFAVYMFDSPTMAKAATERDLPELGLDAKKVKKRALGKLLVSVPSNDMLLYADGRHAAAELALTAITERAFQEAERGVSPHVFKWTAKGWVAQVH